MGLRYCCRLAGMAVLALVGIKKAAQCSDTAESPKLHALLVPFNCEHQQDDSQSVPAENLSVA